MPARFETMIPRLALVAAAAFLPIMSAGQSPLPRFASAFLPADHWAVDAARRTHAQGLTPRELGWPDGSLSRREAALMLRAAAADAQHRSPAHARAAAAVWSRFADEFPATVAALGGADIAAAIRGEGAITSGFESRRGDHVPGFADWIQNDGAGPVAVPSSSDIAGGVTWSATPVSFLALDLSPRRSHGEWSASEGYAVLRLRDAGLWLGRRSLTYGPGEGGGIILNPTAAFTGGGVSVGATRLPWILRHVGPVRFEGFLSEVDSSFAVKHPWVMVNHASASPHRRLLLGLTHGAIFAGSGRPAFNARNFIAMVTLGRATKGSATEEFENQLLSGEIRFLPPVGGLPLELHLEWGTEDNQGAWYQVPATQFGARIVAMPGFPVLSMGVERTEFEPPCSDCGNQGFGSNWYRHYIYKAGWTEDGSLLGHPLGGNGVEWLAHAHADLADTRLRVDARFYRRERDGFNIFAPDLAGRSVGWSLGGGWRLIRGVEAIGSIDAEELPSGRRRVVGFVGGRALF